MSSRTTDDSTQSLAMVVVEQIPRHLSHGADRAEFECAARLLSRLAGMPDVRSELIAPVRDDIAAGRYETLAALDAAMVELGEALTDAMATHTNGATIELPVHGSGGLQPGVDLNSARALRDRMDERDDAA